MVPRPLQPCQRHPSAPAALEGLYVARMGVLGLTPLSATCLHSCGLSEVSSFLGDALFTPAKWGFYLPRVPGKVVGTQESRCGETSHWRLQGHSSSLSPRNCLTSVDLHLSAEPGGAGWTVSSTPCASWHSTMRECCSQLLLSHGPDPVRC